MSEPDLLVDKPMVRMRTYGEIVQRYFPDIKRKTAEFILWEMTAFPACDTAHLEGQLAALAAKVRPHKRGWPRRLGVEARRAYARMSAMLAAGCPSA